MSTTKDTEESIELALRVEDAILRLDARLSTRAAFDREGDGGMRWRSLVAEWRSCVQRFGPGSASARGVLLELVREARRSPSRPARGRVLCAWRRASGWWVVGDNGACLSGVAGDTEIEVLTVALESAP